MRVQASPPDHFPWLCQRVDYWPAVDLRAIEAVDEAGVVHGMVGYDGWMHNSVRMHLAVDGAMALRALLGPAFSYPFNEAKRGVLLALVPSHSKRHLSVVRRLGFIQAHVIRDGFAPGDDVFLFEMRRADCRWLKPTKQES